MKNKSKITVINHDNTTFESVFLKEITASKTNPRQLFREEDLQELKQSIKENGVIQAIVLRLVDGKKELVCGERRFRASLLLLNEDANRNKIPARIYENLTDAEALEMQLIENMQREDVSPMEEAKGFKRLMEAKKTSVAELALRVGKSATYVAQRLKLNDLYSEFQNCLLQNIMSLRDAMILCRLSISDQETIWETKFKEDFENEELEEVVINEHSINKYLLDLLDAPFDVEDKNLDKKMGACSGCPFNTANNTLLFPEMADEARCTNSPCYNSKTSISFKSQLEKALKIPEIELVSTDYSDFESQALELQEKGHVIHSRNEFQEVEAPTAPDLEEFKTDFEDEVYENEEEMLTAYNEALASYNEELLEYEELKRSDKYVPAFVVQGNNIGKIIYVVLGKEEKYSGSKGTSAKDFQEKIKALEVTEADINNELSRINLSETRKKELDNEKIQPFFYETLKQNKTFPQSKKALSQQENASLLLVLMEYGGRTVNEIACAEIETKSEHDSEEMGVYQSFLLLDVEAQQEILNMLLRLSVIDKFKPFNGSRPDKSAKAHAVKALSYEYCNEEATAIWNKQMEARTKREAKLIQRAEELNEKKSALVRVDQLENKAA